MWTTQHSRKRKNKKQEKRDKHKWCEWMEWTRGFELAMNGWIKANKLTACVNCFEIHSWIGSAWITECLCIGWYGTTSPSMAQLHHGFRRKRYQASCCSHWCCCCCRVLVDCSHSTGTCRKTKNGRNKKKEHRHRVSEWTFTENLKWWKWRKTIVIVVVDTHSKLAPSLHVHNRYEM